MTIRPLTETDSSILTARGTASLKVEVPQTTRGQEAPITAPDKFTPIIIRTEHLQAVRYLNLS
jgi:hypothetical protein